MTVLSALLAVSLATSTPSISVEEHSLVVLDGVLRLEAVETPVGGTLSIYVLTLASPIDITAKDGAVLRSAVWQLDMPARDDALLASYSTLSGKRIKASCIVRARTAVSPKLAFCEAQSVNASNTSFKVTRRPVTQFAVANWAPAHHAPQLDR